MLVKFGKTLERQINPVDYGFPPESELSPVAQHVIYIGLRNIGMDSHANDTEDKHGADYIAKAGETLTAKLAALAAGDIRVAGTREADPVARQMRQLAQAAAVKSLKAQHGKDFKHLKSEVLTAATNKVLANNQESLRKIATRMVKAAAEFKVDVNLE